MNAPWATKPLLVVSELVRMPDSRVFVVGFVSQSRARVYPLTPTERHITVHERGKPGVVEKEIQQTGAPIDISPNSVLPRVDVNDLSEPEFVRLTRYIESGGEFGTL